MLFEYGSFVLHSGSTTTWRINCDILTEQDWDCIANIVMEQVPYFGEVEGVPTGGLHFAQALRPYISEGPLLIVDDVLTTGKSMEQHRGQRDAIGVVLFARGLTPSWVTTIFTTLIFKER